MNPADAIPSEWLAAAQSWAPYALGVFALVTVTARPLHWAAQRFEAYAATTAARWDDNAASKLVDVLAATVTLTAFVWSLVPRGLAAFAPKDKAGHPALASREPEGVQVSLVGGSPALATLSVRAESVAQCSCDGPNESCSQCASKEGAK